MTLDEVAGHFQNVRLSGSGFSARCPIHDDNRNSLSGSNGDNGVMIFCHACGEERKKDILAAVGLTFADLFFENGNGHAGPPLTISFIYDYQDEAGKLLFQVCRMIPKDFRQRRPDGKGGHVWNIKGVDRVLYRLPDLLKADHDETIFLVEGERDVENLRAIGLVCTTNPGGAGKWRPEFNKILKGRHLVIIPDNDPPGLKHAEDVAQSLRGTAATIKIVNLPGVPPKGDVSDWLMNAGHTADELRALADAAPIWTPTTETTKPPDTVESFPRTDSGNAEMLANRYGKRLRYDHRQGRWLLWSADKWARDRDGEIHRLAKDAARARYHAAADIHDDAERKRESKFSIDSESRSRIESALSLAQSERPIADRGDEWDDKQNLISCGNGILKLGRT